MSHPDFEVDQWVEVRSSNLSAVGTKDDFLIVQFRNGEMYRYPDLAHEMEEILNAESSGKYFHQNIRHQSYERLEKGSWPEAQ